MICPRFRTPTLSPTPPSFTHLLFCFPDTPTWSCFEDLVPAIFSFTHTAHALTSLKSLLLCQLLNEACPSPSYRKLQTITPSTYPPPYIHLSCYTVRTTIRCKEYFYLFITHPSYWNVHPQRQCLSVLFTVVTPGAKNRELSEHLLNK